MGNFVACWFYYHFKHYYSMTYRLIASLAAFLLMTPHLQADDFKDAMLLKEKAEKEQASGSLAVAMKMFIEAEELFAKCKDA